MRFIHTFFLVFVVLCLLVTISGTGEGQYHPGLEFSLDGSDEDANLDGFEISDSRIMRSYLIEDEEYFDYMCWKYGYGSYYNDTSLRTYPAPNLNCPHTETIWRHLHDCSKYLICEPKTKHGTNINHAMFSCKCEESEIFSIERGNCERKEKVSDCLEESPNYDDQKILQAYVVSADSVKPTPNIVNLPIRGHGSATHYGEKISQLDSECIYMGKFPLENYCDRYIQCKTGPDGKLEAHLHICPKRKHYSKNYRICMHPHLARCPYGGEDLAISSKGSSYGRATSTSTSTIPASAYQGSGSATNPPQLMISDSRFDHDTAILQNPKTEPEPGQTAVARPEIYSTDNDYNIPPNYTPEERENSYKTGAGRRIAGRTHDDLEDLETDSNSGGNYQRMGNPLVNEKLNIKKNPADGYQKLPITPFKKGPRKFQPDHDVPKNYVSKPPFTFTYEHDQLKHDMDQNKYAHGGGSSKDKGYRGPPQESYNENNYYRRTNKKNNSKNNYDAPRNYIIVSPSDQTHLKHNYDMSRLVYQDENPPTHKKHQFVHGEERPLLTHTDEDDVLSGSLQNSTKYEHYGESHYGGVAGAGPRFRDHEEMDIGEEPPSHFKPHDDEYKDQLVSTDNHGAPMLSSTKDESTTHITEGLLTGNETQNLSFSGAQKYPKNELSSNDKEHPSNHDKKHVQNVEDAESHDSTKPGLAISLVPGNHTAQKSGKSVKNSPAYVDNHKFDHTDQEPPRIKEPPPSSTETETDQENPAAGATAKKLPALPKKRPALLFKDDEKPLELHDDFNGYFDNSARKKPSKKLSSKDQDHSSSAPAKSSIVSPGRGKKLPEKNKYDTGTAANKSTVLPVREPFQFPSVNKRKEFEFPKEDAQKPEKYRNSFEYTTDDVPPHINPESGQKGKVPQTAEKTPHNIESPGSQKSAGKFVFEDGKHPAFEHNGNGNDKQGSFEPPLNHDEEFGYNEKAFGPHDFAEHMNRNAHTETETETEAENENEPLNTDHEPLTDNNDQGFYHADVAPPTPTDQKESPSAFAGPGIDKTSFNHSGPHEYVELSPLPNHQDTADSARLFNELKTTKDDLNKNRREKFVFTENKDEHPSSFSKARPSGSGKKLSKPQDYKTETLKNKTSKSSNDEYGHPKNKPTISDDKYGHPKNKPIQNSDDQYKNPKSNPSKNVDGEYDYPKSQPSKYTDDKYRRPKNLPSKNSGDEYGRPKNKPSKASDDKYERSKNKPSKYSDDKYGHLKNKPSKNSDDQFGRSENIPSETADDEHDHPNNESSKNSHDKFGSPKNKQKNLDGEYGHPKNKPFTNSDDQFGRSETVPSKNSDGEPENPKNKPSKNSDDKHAQPEEESFTYQKSGPLNVKDSKDNILFTKDSQQQQEQQKHEPSYNDEGPPVQEPESHLNTEHKPPSLTNEKFEFVDHPLPIHAEYERGHSEKGPPLHETSAASGTEKKLPQFKKNDNGKEPPFHHEEEPVPTEKGTRPFDDTAKPMTAALDHIHYIDHKLATGSGSRDEEKPPGHIDQEFHLNGYETNAPTLQNPDLMHSNQRKPFHVAPNDFHSYKPQESHTAHGLMHSDNESENPEIPLHKSTDTLLTKKEQPPSKSSPYLGQHSDHKNEPGIPDEKFEKPVDHFENPTGRQEHEDEDEAHDPEYSGEDSPNESDEHPLYNDEELAPHSLQDALGLGPHFRSHLNYESEYSGGSQPEQGGYMPSAGYTEPGHHPYEDNDEPFYNNEEPSFQDDANPFVTYHDSEPQMDREPLVHYNYKLDHREEEPPRDEHYNMPYSTEQEDGPYQSSNGYIETPGYSDSDSDKNYSPSPLGPDGVSYSKEYPIQPTETGYRGENLADYPPYEAVEPAQGQDGTYSKYYETENVQESPLYTNGEHAPTYKKSPAYQINYEPTYYNSEEAAEVPAQPLLAPAYEKQDPSFTEANYPSKQNSDSFYSPFPPEHEEYEEPFVSERLEFDNVNNYEHPVNDELGYFDQEQPVFVNEEPIEIEKESPYHPLDDEELLVNKNSYQKFRSFYN